MKEYCQEIYGHDYSFNVLKLGPNHGSGICDALASIGKSHLGKIAREGKAFVSGKNPKQLVGFFSQLGGKTGKRKFHATETLVETTKVKDGEANQPDTWDGIRSLFHFSYGKGDGKIRGWRLTSEFMDGENSFSETVMETNAKKCPWLGAMNDALRSLGKTVYALPDSVFERQRRKRPATTPLMEATEEEVPSGKRNKTNPSD